MPKKNCIAKVHFLLLLSLDTGKSNAIARQHLCSWPLENQAIVSWIKHWVHPINHSLATKRWRSLRIGHTRKTAPADSHGKLISRWLLEILWSLFLLLPWLLFLLLRRHDFQGCQTPNAKISWNQNVLRIKDVEKQIFENEVWMTLPSPSISTIVFIFPLNDNDLSIPQPARLALNDWTASCPFQLLNLEICLLNFASGVELWNLQL